MAGEYVPSGVELAVKGLGQFLSDLKSADNAIAKMGSGVSVSTAPFVDIGNSILDVGAKATQVAMGGIAVLGAAITAVAIKGAADFMELEQGMADIEAISGDTAAEVAPLKDLISELALDPQLKVTTDEAQQALYALTKQGLEVDEIMAGAGRSTIELANATGGPFKQSAEISAQAMNIWSMEASEMGKVADSMTGVLTNSKFEVNDYALAIAQGGATAANFGVSFEDFNTVIAGSANAFSSGSDAGTSFKTMMLRLAAPTNEMKAAMQQYGISMFDAQGQMRDWKDIVGDLNTALYGNVTITSTVGGVTKEVAEAAKNAAEDMPDLTQTLKEQAETLDILKNEYALTLQHYDPTSTKARNLANRIDSLTYDYNKNLAKLGEYEGAMAAASGAQEQQISTTRQLTEAERAKLAETLGGADAARLLLEVGKMTEEEFAALSETVNANGQAMDAAATRMDTTKGALEILQGIIEAVQLQIGEKFTPVVREIAEAMSAWISENSGPVIEFFGQIATGVEDAVASLMKIGGAFARFGIKGAARSIMGQLGFDQESIAQVTAIIDQIKTVLSTEFGTMASNMSIMNLGMMLGFTPEEVASVLTTFNTIKEYVTSFAQTVKDTLSQIGFDEIKGALIGLGAVVTGGVFAAIIAGLLTLLTPINLIIAGAALLGAAWAGNWGDIQGITTSVVTYIGETLTSLTERLTPAFNSVWESLSRLGEALSGAGANGENFSNVMGAVGTFILDVAVPAFIELAGILADTLAMSISAMVDGMVLGNQVFNDVSAFITGTVIPAFTDLVDTISGALNVALKYMADLWANSVQPALIKVNNAITPVSELLEAMGEVSIAVTNKALEALAGWAETTGENLATMGRFITSKVLPPIQDAAKWLGDRLSPAVKRVGEFLTDILAPGFADTQGVVGGELVPTLKDLSDVVLPILEKGIEIVSEAIERMTNLFKGMADAVNNFSLPDVLTPGSPPPMAYAMMDIATGANQAGEAIKSMNKQLQLSKKDTFLDDLQLGGQLDAFGAGGHVKRFYRNLLKSVIGENMGAIMDGASPEFMMDKITSTASQYNLNPQLAKQFTEVNGLMDQLNAKAEEFARQTALENMGNLLQSASSLNSIGSQFAEALSESMGSKEEAKEKVETYFELNKAIGDQKDKLKLLGEELIALNEAEGANTLAIQKKNLAIEKSTESIEFSKRQLAIYEAELAQMELGTPAWEKKQLQIDKTSESIDNQTQQLEILRTELEKLEAANGKDTEAIEKKRLALEKLTEELKANELAVIQAQQEYHDMATGPLNEQIEFLKAFLESGQDTIRIIGEELGGVFAGTGITSDIVWDKVSAQEELNRLLEEQARQEELITQQKEAQQQLSKLQAQLDLIKMGKELGVDGIFQGIQFGLEASEADMLQAVNALVNAMIYEIDAGFDLGSPSRLMFEKFGYVVDGARMALEQGKRDIALATNKMLSPIYGMTDMLIPGMGSMSSNTNNYYMTVNTGASASAVIQQYSVAKSMHG